MRTKYIECECGTAEHTLRFIWDNDPLWAEVFVEVFLNEHYGFFKRLWYGIKYIFGFKSKYGQFEEAILSYKKVEELRDLCNEWLDNHQTHEDAPLKTQLMGYKFGLKIKKDEVMEYNDKIAELEERLKEEK